MTWPLDGTGSYLYDLSGVFVTNAGGVGFVGNGSGLTNLNLSGTLTNNTSGNAAYATNAGSAASVPWSALPGPVLTNMIITGTVTNPIVTPTIQSGTSTNTGVAGSPSFVFSSSITGVGTGNAAVASVVGGLTLSPANGMTTNTGQLFVSTNITDGYGVVASTIYHSTTLMVYSNGSGWSNLVAIPVPAYAMGTNRLLHVIIAGDLTNNTGGSMNLGFWFRSGAVTNIQTSVGVNINSKTARQPWLWEGIIAANNSTSSLNYHWWGRIMSASSANTVGEGSPANSEVYVGDHFASGTIGTTTNWTLYFDCACSQNTNMDFSVKTVFAEIK